MMYQKQMAAMATMLLLVIACGGEKKAQGPTSPYFGSYEEAQAAAAKNNLPIMIDFYADW